METQVFRPDYSDINCTIISSNTLSTKRKAMFLFAFLGVKIIDFKNCFISAVSPCYKDLDCTVPS